MLERSHELLLRYERALPRPLIKEQQRRNGHAVGRRQERGAV